MAICNDVVNDAAVERRVAMSKAVAGPANSVPRNVGVAPNDFSV